MDPGSGVGERAEADFRTLVENIPGAVAVHREGRFVYLNPFGARVLGYDRPEELIGRSVLDTVHPQDRQALADEIVSRSQTREIPPPRLQRMMRRDGAALLFEFVSLPVQFEGLPSRLLLARDVTGERATEERLRAIIESSPLAVASLDLEYRVLTLNPVGARLFNWKLPHEMLPENRAFVGELCRRAHQQGSAEAEKEMRRVSGALITLRVAVAPLRDPRAEVTGYVAVFVDVSDARRNERARAFLQDALRRAEAMSAMGALVAGVAHEVRNPLFAMTATLDGLEAAAGREPSARLLATLRRELDRINQLMGELLEYGKPPESAMASEPLAPVLSLAVRNCLPAAQRASVELELAAPLDLGVLAMQPGRLAQVFQNLIDNAVQHSAAGACVRIEAALEGGFIEVRVLDRGAGFREDDLRHVFEPFFTRRPGGTGLGLSLVQRIVEQHGGSVVASNRAGGGAQMAVRLPAPQPP